MKIDPSEYIGMEYGIYTIEEVTSETRKDGRLLLKGRCNECGYTRLGTISDFKKIFTQCKHVIFSKMSKTEISAWYDKNKNQCLNCGNDIPLTGCKKPSHYKEKKFCSQSCATSYNNKGVVHNRKEGTDYSKPNLCLICKKEITWQNKFCSSKCEKEFEYKNFIERWKAGTERGIRGFLVSSHIRRYLMEKFNSACSQCGWSEVNPFTDKIPLEVHHNDGDYTNNKEDNLDLLCPNCHALTPNYCSGNNGKGRISRIKNNGFVSENKDMKQKKNSKRNLRSEQKEINYQEYIKRWKLGEETGCIGKDSFSPYIRRYILEKYNHSCSCCGWNKRNIFTGVLQLEVHHKDGNRKNNAEDNLVLLCRNCHSLTKGYMGGKKKKNCY